MLLRSIIYRIAFFIIIPSLSFCEVDFLLFTVPKSGTHLLADIVNQITNCPDFPIGRLDHEVNLDKLKKAQKSNHYSIIHLLTDSQLKQLIDCRFKFIMIYRDPRDQLVSLLHWTHFMSEESFPPVHIKEQNELIKEFITGEIYGFPVYEHFFECVLKQSKQIPSDQVLIFKFEDLVHPKGRGDFNKQIPNILSIGSFLGHSLTYEQAKTIAEKSWTKTPTFRKGTIGQWIDYFTPEHIQLYKERYGQVLIDLGYEKDFDW